MNIHENKLYWVTKRRLKRAGKISLFGFILFPVPVLSMVIVTCGAIMATKAIIDMKIDLSFMDYVLNAEE